MFYENELRFVRETIHKCRIQTQLIDLTKPIVAQTDMGARGILYGGDLCDRPFGELFFSVKERTVYRYIDPFSCRYVLLKLPDVDGDILLSIGPYLTAELSRERILEQAEQAGATPRQSKRLEEYYAEVPLLSDVHTLFAIVDTFAERLFGKRFAVEDIVREGEVLEPSVELSHLLSDDPAWSMQTMEKRYAYENEMMQAVEQGNIHKAELFLNGLSDISFEKRLVDPLRNLKNYCIIMNTLLRKAAERGGVHPVYLDTLSSSFARKIELLPSVVMGRELMQELFRSYCRLVRKHSTRHYSFPVQKVIAYIDADLTADLSLRTLAKAQQLSDGYLSTLFHKETGKTLTDYVNERRIRLAKQLLETTTLQIQTVAQHCGILDIHYFTRLFKKHTGQTPRAYREATRGK